MRTFGRLLSRAALACALAAGAPAAHAGDNDAEVATLIDTVFETDVTNADFAAAIEKLELAKQACGTDGCTARTRARVEVALGTVLAGGLGRKADAAKAFARALALDAGAALVEAYATAAVKAAWESAKRGDADDPKATGRDPAVVVAERGCAKAKLAPRPWKKPQAECLFRVAKADRDKGDPVRCHEAAIASIALEDWPSTRMIAATCASQSGRLLEALGEYNEVARVAGTRQYNQGVLAKDAKKKAAELRKRVPRVVVAKAAGLGDVQVTVDGEPAVAAPAAPGGDALEFLVNPGPHRLIVTATRGGKPVRREKSIESVEGEAVRVDVGADALAGDGVGPAAVVKKPVPGSGAAGDATAASPSAFNVRFGTEISGYADSDHTGVLTPAVLFALDDPTAGFTLAGSFVVDAVSAASVDVVSNASPGWREIRYAPALAVRKKFGAVDAALRGSVSVEPDYLATGAGATLAFDARQKTVTPALGYDFGYDVVGRAGTPFDVFSRKVIRHGVNLGSTFVTSASTRFTMTGTAVLESGDQSKPYRYVPMFTRDVAPRVRPGQTIDSVNEFREPERVLDRLPVSRSRFAFAARIARRGGAATVRADTRLYADSWGLKASTTDFRWFIDATRSFRVWPHLRFHAQSGVDFWRLAYAVTEADDGTRAVPSFRTGDRELGPLLAGTGGLGMRLAFGEGDAFALGLQGDAIYTRFLDTLYILQRLGVLTTLTFEVTVK